MSNVRKPSYRLKPADVPPILERLMNGEYQNRIAADYDVNPGRIAEIKKRFLESSQPRLL